jgi:phosphoglycerate dehydrogenase-like enzyme
MSSDSGSKVHVVIQQGMVADLLRSKLDDDVELHAVPTIDSGEVEEVLPEADALISNRITAEIASNALGLRLIQTTGIGTDAIELTSVPAGAVVCNVRGHENAVTEYAFMVMLALLRDLPGLERRIRSGDWSDRNAAPKLELRGRTLGLIGLGSIGREAARLAHAFGMSVSAITRHPDPERARELGIDQVAGFDHLHDLLREADIVLLAVPSSEETRNLIGEREFELMKPDSFLVNVARGNVVDEAALYRALSEKQIAGAGIDVWYQYPTSASAQVLPSRHPFHELDNVIMTPHIAGWTDGTTNARLDQIVENLRRLKTGEAFLNVVFGNRSGASSD